MISMPELHPVVEAPWFEGVAPWPWPIAARQPFTYIRLSGEVTQQEVGSIMAQVVSYNMLELNPDIESELRVEDLLSQVIAAEMLLLPGGIQASAKELEINPSCCCGINDWLGWLEFLETRHSPWMGHNPAPRLERIDKAVRVWSDGGEDPAPNAWSIEFDTEKFVAELERVERELLSFLPCVSEWANAVRFSDPPALCRKIDVCIQITGSQRD